MVFNQTKKTKLAETSTVCKTIFSKARGLMFSKKKTLIFVFTCPQRVSLHMLFVFFPIWVIYLDKNKKVIFKKKLLPFISFINPKQHAQYVIELVNKPKASIGDLISWQ